MVSLGGGDPGNVTLKVVQALQEADLDGAEVVTLVGAANPHLEEISAAANASRWLIHVYINARDMSELLAEVDFAITAAGSTSLEMAFMALPFIVLVVADNQRLVAEYLASAGIAVNLGWFEDAPPARIKREAARVLRSPECRGEMSRRGRALVDGEGAERVVMQIRGDRLRLRPVRQGDCRLLWEWANDPQTRASAFSSRLVSWDEHTTWFNRSLTDPGCFMFLATDEHDVPVGQTRFNLKEDGMAEIDVSVNPTRRGAGYGALLISLGVVRLFRQHRLGCVRALIKAENIASARAFEKAGFRQLGRQIVQGQEALAYARERSHDHE
jgi:UDP-2,4-diacetamido-2,4,6-trideoxy-beta-L-altropyranose hydrolase